MKPDEIHLNDWVRIVFGTVPPEFYIELVIRGLVVYLLLLVSMRLLGKRMAGQLSRLDLAAMVALASSIGVSMLSPVNGILPAFIIAIIIVAISRLISYLSIKSEKIEELTQGDIDTLVENGVMRLQTMKKVRVTRERLFAQLRSSKIEHLGKINRMYMEANGKFSLVPAQTIQPGLLILPEWDTAFIDEKLKKTDVIICKRCGSGNPGNNDKHSSYIKCSNCGASDWTQAVIEK